jgi:hypothetical protein
MMFTDAQLAQYEEQGAVTIDSPFTTEELDKAERAWDRWERNRGDLWEDQDYLDVIQHPYFEEVAKKLLRADTVHLWWGLNPHERAPAPPPYGTSREQWSEGLHVDVQATLEDFDATPRRMRAELWFWLNDVPADRGAMRILPGSHRPIMEHWSRILRPEHKKECPRVHGLRSPPIPEKAMACPEHIPDLADKPWIEHEPTPQVATRGQILLVCTSGLHSAWQNEDSVPRKAMGTSWIAAGVSGGLPKNQRDDMMAAFPLLKRNLRPERAHIVPDNFDWIFESGYDTKWEETCLPSRGE